MEAGLTTEILIIGAGPSGLTLALELKRKGLDALIIDKHEHGLNTSRAGIIHAKTLEVLEASGVTDDLLIKGLKLTTFHLRDHNRILAKIDFSHLKSKYNFVLMCPQNITEDILLLRLKSLGGSVLRSFDVLSMEEKDNFVYVDTNTPNGPVMIKARYVVGCDGMHSIVRKQAGIVFKGAPYEQKFVLADVRADLPYDRKDVSLFLSPNGMIVVAPLPDNRTRIVTTDNLAPDTPDIFYMQNAMNTRGPANAKIREIFWGSSFNVHHRLAETDRKGPFLLVGDAAHVHSPAGGQGMNLGIRDAVSLAETFALNNDRALDEWAWLRRRQARKIIRMTDRMTKIAILQSPLMIVLRNMLLRLINHLPSIKKKISNALSGLSIE